MSLPELLKDKRRQVNFSPSVVIDVGANRGGWTRALLGSFPMTKKVLLMEASSKHTSRLEKVKQDLSSSNTQIDFQIAVLADVSGQQVDFFDNGDTGNSMFRENTAHYASAAATKRETITLDDMVASSFLSSEPKVDLLKLDVQGAELMVLKGATRVLDQTTFVQLETSVVNFNTGGACPWEIDEFLRSKGYRMLDIWDFNYDINLFKTPGLGQYDVLYVNTNHRPKGILESVEFCEGTTTSPALRTTLDGQPARLEGAVVGPTAADQTSYVLDKLFYLCLGYLVCYLQGRLRVRRGRTE